MASPFTCKGHKHVFCALAKFGNYMINANALMIKNINKVYFW